MNEIHLLFVVRGQNPLEWVPVVICLSVQIFKSSLPNFLFGMNLAAI